MTTTKKPAPKPVAAKAVQNKPEQDKPVQEKALTAKPAVAAKSAQVKPPATVSEMVTPAPVASAPIAPAPAVSAPVAVVVAPPVAPVVAKPVEAPVAAKPVEAPAPAAKVATKAPAKAKAPAMLDAMQPFAVLQEQIRKQTEANAEQVRANYAAFKGNAERATVKLEESIIAARTGAKVFGEKVLDAVRMQAQVGLDHAKALGAAKDLGEVAKLQQAFVLKQIEALKAQTEEFAAFTTKVANDVSEPAKASIAAAFKR